MIHWPFLANLILEVYVLLILSPGHHRMLVSDYLSCFARLQSLSGSF